MKRKKEEKQEVKKQKQREMTYTDVCIKGKYLYNALEKMFKGRFKEMKVIKAIMPLRKEVQRIREEYVDLNTKLVEAYGKKNDRGQWEVDPADGEDKFNDYIREADLLAKENIEIKTKKINLTQKQLNNAKVELDMDDRYILEPYFNLKD